MVPHSSKFQSAAPLPWKITSGLQIPTTLYNLLDFMDKTVKDPEFILNELQLPFLAAIPQTNED